MFIAFMPMLCAGIFVPKLDRSGAIRTPTEAKHLGEYYSKF